VDIRWTTRSFLHAQRTKHETQRDSSRCECVTRRAEQPFDGVAAAVEDPFEVARDQDAVPSTGM